jgi:hypothetical protein
VYLGSLRGRDTLERINYSCNAKPSIYTWCVHLFKQIHSIIWHKHRGSSGVVYGTVHIECASSQETISSQSGGSAPLRFAGRTWMDFESIVLTGSDLPLSNNQMMALPLSAKLLALQRLCPLVIVARLLLDGAWRCCPAPPKFVAPVFPCLGLPLRHCCVLMSVASVHRFPG